ncbi:MAG: M23 family metallopeptidase [Ruminococcaceae bacterium]|nr:M23 family metallopeptidase [Oscillospiraceae bacterium]
MVIFMKFYESKAAKFIAGKGFYVVLAICMAVIGVAAYTALEKSEPEPFIEEGQFEENNEDFIIPSMPDEEDLTFSDDADAPVSEATDVTEETNPPVFVMPIEGNILKPFSEDTLTYSATYKDMRIHTGVDIAPTVANVVVSAFSGTVIGVDENTNFGTVITIDHGDGIVLSYCGVKNVTVKSGDMVEAEEIIGEIGTVLNESADKPHLHLELMVDGQYKDPLTLFDYH